VFFKNRFVTVPARFAGFPLESGALLLPLGILFLLLSGCADKSLERMPDPLRSHVDTAFPNQGTATPLPLNGPFRRSVYKITAMNGRLAVAIQDVPVVGKVTFYVTDDAGVWIWRDTVPEAPTMLSAAFGYYWMASSRGFASFSVAGGIPQGFPQPPEGRLRELVGFEDRLVSVAGNNKILTATNGSPWTTSATVDPGETLIGIATTPPGLCALSSSSRKAWVNKSNGNEWNQASVIPPEYGELLQLAAGPDHTYVLTKTSVLVGDTDCSHWKPTPPPPAVSAFYSIAVFGATLYLGTDVGLFDLQQDQWGRVEIDPTRSIVRGLAFNEGRLYAGHESGLDESTDFGDHWEPTTPPLDHGTGVLDIRSTAKSMFAATRTGLFRRTGSKENWTPVALPGDAKGTVTALETSRDGKILTALASAGAIAREKIFLSSDDGKTFADVTFDLVSSRIAELVLIDSLAFAATENGVYDLDQLTHRWKPDRESLGDSAITALSRYGTHGLLAASLTDVWLKPDVVKSKSWDKLNPNQGFAGISDVWSDPSYPGAIYVASGGTLLFTTSPHELFRAYLFRPEKHPIPMLSRFANYRGPNGNSLLFAGSSFGTYFIYDDLPRPGPAARLVSALRKYQHDYSDELWFWPVTVIGGFLSAYVIGLIGLLMLLSIRMPPIFGRGWLLTLVAKPLTISPGLGRWALFLGYRRRLARLPGLVAVAQNYFGLSARLPDGKVTAPDSTGQVLHAHLLKQLTDKNCILLLGRPGSGKTSVLAKLALLAGQKGVLNPLDKLIPIFIPSEYYKGNLVEAASRVLRERDRIPLDASEMLNGQMEYGKLLFLFDGLSEVLTDRTDASTEIVRTAGLPDYQRCYFVVASRFFETLPQIPKIELLPLTQQAIREVYLPSYQLEPAKEDAVLQQLQQFDQNTRIDALLFAMIVSAAQSQSTGLTRSQLYQNYFRQALNVSTEEKEPEWSGWKYLLEHTAGWFSLATGRRAQGLAHEVLMDCLLGKDLARGAAVPMAERLRQYYGINVQEERELLQRLSSAGILLRGKTWRFAHDSFEEYFSALRLASLIDKNHSVPDLKVWSSRPEDFLEVLRYFRESASSESQTLFFSQQGLPASWSTLVTATSAKPPHPRT
jgi:hypothetical protein